MTAENSPPAPFVSIDLDLRDYRWMRLDIIALGNSDFNSTADDTAWRAGVTLWCKAWHQVPAGSLPNDDKLLCNMAGFGRDLKQWMRVRATALHGFVTCSDDRLYHRFLCGMALKAAEEQSRYLKKKEADRERKFQRKSGGRSSGIPDKRGEDRKRREGSPPPYPPQEFRPSPVTTHIEGAHRAAEAIIARMESRAETSDPRDLSDDRPLAGPLLDGRRSC
jgi:hypothetical protein